MREEATKVAMTKEPAAIKTHLLGSNKLNPADSKTKTVMAVNTIVNAATNVKNAFIFDNFYRRRSI